MAVCKRFREAAPRQEGMPAKQLAEYWQLLNNGNEA
jgi:hypothetical protein